MSVFSLFRLSAQYQELRRRILEIEPDIEEDVLADSLDGASDLKEAIAQVIRSALSDEDRIAALKARIGDLRLRQQRLERTAERKRRAAQTVMETAAIERIVEADLTVSLRATAPTLIVIDEGLIADEFKIPQAPRLDRRRLSEALKAGREIPGAMLGNAAASLAVLTK